VDAPQHLIYGLVDPRTMLVRYVGCSSRGLTRPRQHVAPRERKFNRYKDRWIAQLEAAGLSYEIAVLAPSTRETLKADEVWWIAYGRASGWPLTNLTDGGDGTLGFVSGPETRAKISAYHKGRKHSAEHNAKVAEANRGRVATIEARENMRRAHIGKVQSPELVAKRAAAIRAANATARAAFPRPAIRINLIGAAPPPRRKPHPPVTEETRAKMRASKLGRTLPPEHVAKIADSNRGQKRTPEQRARLVAAQRVRFAGLTHCPHGHALTPENIRPNRRGRECKACWLKSAKTSSAKKTLQRRFERLIAAWEGF
jgi:hypothetical protein